MKLLSKSWIIPFKISNTLSDDGMASNGIISTDINVADSIISDLCDVLTEGGWEIKSVIPLISGLVFGTALINEELLGPKLPKYGGGYGYGASFTAGVIVLAQRWVEEDSGDLKGQDAVADDTGSIVEKFHVDNDEETTTLDLSDLKTFQCPTCKNILVLNESDSSSIYQWCPYCNKEFK